MSIKSTLGGDASLADATHYKPLGERTLVLLLNAAIFYGVFIIATGRGLPTGGLESVWLFSAIALWFLTLLSSPWFLPPRDSVANAVGALSILVTLDLTGVPHFQSQLDILRWIAVAYSVGVVVLSLAALFMHDRAPAYRGSKLAYRLVGTFGPGEILYTVPALISIVGAYQDNFATMAWLLVLWIVFVVARPVEQVVRAFRQWSVAGSANLGAAAVGVIARVDDPNIVRVRLSAGAQWTGGGLYTASMPGGHQRHVVALFAQTQGLEVIGTGMCVATAEEAPTMPAGEVRHSIEAARAPEFLEALSGTKGADLVGFVVENSTIGTLHFEMAMATGLEEGEVVFARVDGQDIFYQILDAETSEESFDQNPRGKYIVRAAQLGCYSAQNGFTKYAWLPPMNSPLFAAKTRTFDLPTLSDRDFVIGNVPSTGVGVPANIDDLVEFHSAILGVTGTGKTELALDVVREAVAKGIKVFCVDFTGDYRQRLSGLDPELPGPSSEEAADLEEKLFAADTGAYGAGAEKKALKAAIDGLRGSVGSQIKGFLEGDKNLAILELTDITNTKASLRLTELYLSTIMDWARPNRKARQVLIVLEEAHTIIPEVHGSGFDYDTQWVVGRIGQIALQGRKYGVGLLVVTQRTALVSKTILSQCNTFLTHSLIDQTSLSFLESVYSSQHVKLIPNLQNLHLLAFGKAVRAERPIMLKREFDPKKKEASDALKRPLERVADGNAPAMAAGADGHFVAQQADINEGR